MTTAEIALVLLSALLHAIWSASIKGSASPLGFNLLQLAPPFAAAAALALFVPLSAIPTAVWWVVAGTGLCHGFYFYFLARALETGELSVVYPIARSAPAFLPLVAVPLLGESIDGTGALGIAVVVLGMIAIQVDGARGLARAPAAPDAHAADAPTTRPSSLTFALLTLVASVGYSLFDKTGMSELGRAPWDVPVPRAIVYYVLLSLSGGLVFAPLALRRVPPRALAALARTELRPAVVAALVSFASYGLILQALVTAPVSYVVAARQSSVLFAVAIGALRWHERPSRLRLAGALATVAGVALVAQSR